jgi:secreted trypsin-like serine protease
MSPPRRVHGIALLSMASFLIAATQNESGAQPSESQTDDVPYLKYGPIFDPRYPDPGDLDAAPLHYADAADLPPADADVPLPRPQTSQKKCSRRKFALFGPRKCKRVTKFLRGMGGFVADAGQAPWQAQIQRPASQINRALLGKYALWDQQNFCGGSLIAPGWVLTAAHCAGDELKNGYRLRLGVSDIGAAEGADYPIVGVFRHPGYSSESYANDIALLRFGKLIGPARSVVHRVQPILPDPVPTDKRSTEKLAAVLYGWGRTTEAEDGHQSQKLLGARIDLRSERECANITKFGIDHKDIALCGQGKSGADHCHGDSGGPLVFYDPRPILIGVVSFGWGCGTRGKPGFYARVSAYRRWITTYTGPIYATAP